MTASSRTFCAGAVLAMMTVGGQAALAQEATTIGLTEALGTAEREVDGRAFGVERDSEDGRQTYEVKVAGAEDRVYEIDVDAETGEVVSREEQRIEGLRRRWLNTEELQTVTGAEQSLADIIASVENETGATLEESEIDTDDGRVVYEMELLSPDGTEIEATVDAGTGEILEQETDD